MEPSQIGGIRGRRDARDKRQTEQLAVANCEVELVTAGDAKKQAGSRSTKHRSTGWRPFGSLWLWVGRGAR